MAIAYPTKLMEAFSQRWVEVFYQTPVTPKITNRDWEGDIRGKSSKVNIITFDKLSLQAYTGADLTAQTIYENPGYLTTDQAWAFYFQIINYDTFRSMLKDPKSPLLEQLRNEQKEVVDSYTLGLHTDVASGNRSGTSYTTGTVTITATTGVVEGVGGMTFASGMVGKGFKALGHTKWYRIKSVTDADTLVIEDDSDDKVSAYTGGAIGGGATYEIQANTPTTIDKTTVYAKILELKTILDKAKIPADNRWLVMPADLCNLIPQATSSLLSVQAGWDTMQNGYLGHVGGFALYSNEQVHGDNTDGYSCLAGRTSAITFAMGLVDEHIEPWIKGNAGMGAFGLQVYGAKVLDERRKALAEGFWKV